MKKATFIVSLILTTGLCFGAEQEGTVKMSKPSGAIATQVVQGTIDSINLADPAKKLKAEISLKQENGSVVKFLLSEPVVYDGNSMHITLSQLKTGEKAKVQYFTTKEGVREAKSITLVR